MDRHPLRHVRRWFLAGLLVLVPLGVTAWVVWALVTTLNKVGDLLPAAWQPEAIVGRPLPGVGVVLTFAAILVVGFATQNFVGRRLIWLYEGVLLRVPVLSSVYVTVKQLLSQLVDSDRGFERVVLVQWPRRGVWAVAFMTGSGFARPEGAKESLVNVFLPTTPNPTTGFYFLVPADEIVPTDMTVEEAFKLLMSAGIVAPREVILPAGTAPTAPSGKGRRDRSRFSV